jgi:peptidoglycan glycosyltransferase
MSKTRKKPLIVSLRLSPMLRRVRHVSRPPWLRIPRRGRIRVFLGVVGVVAAVMVLRSMTGRHGGAPATKEPETLETVSRDRQSRAVFRKRNIDAADVASVLRTVSPHFFASADTFSENGRTLVFHYSIDTLVQQTARKLLRRYHPRYGAVAALDPGTGRVLALVSYVNDGEPSLGPHLYCRSRFPAASLFKIVTSAGCVELGRLNCNSMLRQTGRNHTLYKYQLEKDLERYRKISLVKAFAYSINPVFGRLGIYVLGKEGLDRMVRTFGFGDTIPFDLDLDPARAVVGDSAFALAELASGFNSQTRISPLFAALMVSAVAEDGVMPRPSVVDSVTDSAEGRRIYQVNPAPWRRAIQVRTARELKTMFSDVVRYGTARKSFRYVKRTAIFDSMEYGGKTGNIDDDDIGRVDWFAGFARHPHDERKRIAVGVVTSHGPYWTVHSGFVAAEIIRTYIRHVHYSDTAAAADIQSVDSENTGSS